MSKILTVAIPTFNRSAIIKAQVQELLAADICSLAELLIIDDGSSDGTYSDLLDITAGTPVQVFRNEVNLGYAGNFYELFAKTQTPYIMCSTDDDHILVDRIAGLNEFLESRQPAFVVPQFLINGIYRGRKKTGRVRVEEYRSASAHAPGLVYNRRHSREIIPELALRLKEGCAATFSYPQVMLACNLMVRHGGWWWQEPSVKVGHNLPTGIRPGGSPYYSLSSRWSQHQSFADYFKEKVRVSVGKEQDHWQRMASVADEKIFTTIHTALARERPDLIGKFDEEAGFHYAGTLTKIIRRPGYIKIWVKKSLRRVWTLGRSLISSRGEG